MIEYIENFEEAFRENYGEFDIDFTGRKQLILDMGWDPDLSHTRLFNLKFIDDGTTLHFTKNKIYALSYLIEYPEKNKIVVQELAVNPLLEHKGYGKTAMKDIAALTLDIGYEKLTLSSMVYVKEFYIKIGLEEGLPQQFTGNLKWLKKMSKGVKL